MRTRLQDPQKMVIAKFSSSIFRCRANIHDIRHFCMRFRIDGIKPMSRVLSGGKQVIKFANTSNLSRVCLFSQKEATILDLKNVQFEFRQVLSHHYLL